jgi:F-type H+-transporting ATPase subunit delta
VKSQGAASRYAKALYSIATKNKNIDNVLHELREFSSAVAKDADSKLFFTGPLTKSTEQMSVLEKLFEKKNFSEEMKGLLSLLALKRRFSLIDSIAEEFQKAVDEARSVARGEVVSATTLFPEERQKLEATISKYTGKKAVLEYHEDKKLLGGLVARVGSFTFDDSLDTQLRMVNDELTKRRAH